MSPTEIKTALLQLAEDLNRRGDWLASGMLVTMAAAAVNGKLLALYEHVERFEQAPSNMVPEGPLAEAASRAQAILRVAYPGNLRYARDVLNEALADGVKPPPHIITDRVVVKAKCSSGCFEDRPDDCRKCGGSGWECIGFRRAEGGPVLPFEHPDSPYAEHGRLPIPRPALKVEVVYEADAKCAEPTPSATTGTCNGCGTPGPVGDTHYQALGGMVDPCGTVADEACRECLFRSAEEARG